jgi:hypothetical protein
MCLVNPARTVRQQAAGSADFDEFLHSTDAMTDRLRRSEAEL